MRKLLVLSLITNVFSTYGQLQSKSTIESIENGDVQAAKDYYVITNNKDRLPVKTDVESVK